MGTVTALKGIEKPPFKLLNEGADVSYILHEHSKQISLGTGDYTPDSDIKRVLKTYRAQFEGGIHVPSGNQIVTSAGNRDYTLAREAFVDNVLMIWKISGERLVPGTVGRKY